MRTRFDQQLDLLNIELIKMGALCEDAISTTIKALLDNDEPLRQKVSSIEKAIDQKEKDIEQLCLKILLQQQPVASDLRMVSSALKMISDMERIGDQAYDIAEITQFIGKNEVINKLHIKDMAMATIKMVTDSIDSFVKKDLDMARSVMKYDDVVDNYFNKVKNEISNLIIKDGCYSEVCLDLLMIAKYLERIGDHAVNIAEWVEFSITGKHKTQN